MLSSTRSQYTIEPQFPIHILKNLSEKNQQKKDLASKEIATIIAKNIEKKNFDKIQAIIKFFKENYLKSNILLNKKTGIEAFTSIIFGFKHHPQQNQKFIPMIVLPLLQCFYDTEQKIRYNSIKALYYICKNLHHYSLIVFNDIFENLIAKITDLDDQVKKAAELLNETLQTIITDSFSQNKKFDLVKFMKILTQKMTALNPNVKLFLIKWIRILDQIPNVELLIYLPGFLQDLFTMSEDKQKQLRNKAEQCLLNFLEDLKMRFKEGKLQVILTQKNLSSIITTLIKITKDKHLCSTKLTAINWFQQFFIFFREQLNLQNKNKIKHKYFIRKIIMERFDEILQPILTLLSNQQEQIRKASTIINNLLLQIMQKVKKQQSINFNKVMPLLKQMLSQKKSSTTSDCVLTWMKFLLENYNDKILPEINDIIQKLVQKLCDGNSSNVMGIIQNVSFNQQYFDLVIERLLNYLVIKPVQFKTENIIKKFCNKLNVEKTYRSICIQILNQQKGIFKQQTVHALNYILVTYQNCAGIRKKLRTLEIQQHKQLFKILFKAFSYNPIALISLSYLSQQYELAYRIITSFSIEQQISNQLMIQFCKFINLLESPNFIYLRVHLLERQKYPYLIESMFALLMILPQGKIYNILKNRIDVLNHMKLKQKSEIKKYVPELKYYMEIFSESIKNLNDEKNNK